MLLHLHTSTSIDDRAKKDARASGYQGGCVLYVCTSMSACTCAPGQSTSTGMDQSHPTAFISSRCSQEVRGNTPYMRGLCRLGQPVITTLGVIRLPTVLVYAPVCTMSTKCPPRRFQAIIKRGPGKKGGVSLMRNILDMQRTVRILEESV
jgi:hypothetical protein